MIRIPRATYRLQFTPSFGFKDAAEVVPYLAELGISTLYASPIFAARPGSTHGYDVVDGTRLNPELGSADDFRRLVDAVREHGLTWLQDIVPNHMAFDSRNTLLMDVLEKGPASPHGRVFDIDWEHYYDGLRGRVLAPFLGALYSECLEKGEISLAYGREGLTVRYYDFHFPLRLATYGMVLDRAVERLEQRLGTEDPEVVKFAGVVDLFQRLAEVDCGGNEYDRVEHAKLMLWEACRGSGEVREAVDAAVASFCGVPGERGSFDDLDRLLSHQSFRFSFWKVAAEEINYRRFFTVNDLISVRVEDESVLEATHPLIFELAGEGVFHGLRIDHVDGLYDPERYLRELRRRAPEAYLVVEKILEWDEDLPETWPVQGTSGYEFLNCVNGLFCRRRSRNEFIKLYYRYAGLHQPYDDLVRDKKRLIIGKHMAGNIDNLAHLMKSIASRDRYGKDITLYGLKRALVEFMAAFPVYRTYVTNGVYADADRGRVEDTIAAVRESHPSLTYELSFIERFLLLDAAGLTVDDKDRLLDFVMQFQQYTGPLMAKGFEDTALYIYNKFVSLNEVGGHPNRFGTMLQEFHRFNRARKKRWPHAMNTTSTHDTKRGEDVRARLNVLSELPKEWKKAVYGWTRINRSRKTFVHGAPAPDANDEYFLYQTLAGTFPYPGGVSEEYVKRITEYVVKAVREAKVHTAWIKPDTAYEEAFTAFVREILQPGDDNRFLAEFVPFQRKVAFYGQFNSLSQTVLKIASPGVPDFYQGTELWEFSLVDPDNRRPVDFRRRAEILGEIRERTADDLPVLMDELIRSWPDGRLKLFCLHEALQVRREHPELFEKGRYTRLQVSGPYRNNVVAFARRYRKKLALVVVPRFLSKLVKEGTCPLGREVWGETWVAMPANSPGRWSNTISGEVLESEKALMLGDIFNSFPAALLMGA